MADPASLTCTENIALFHLLHAGRGKDEVLSKDSVPVPPSVAPVEPLPIHREDYVLSFERERSLAGALAYISNIKDDTNRIPAICVEEDHRQRRKSSLRIVLAVNRSECKDGDHFLETVKNGFDGIFQALSQVVDGYGDQVEIEHEIRRLIISMCSNRIVSRLNFKKRKSRRTPKQPAREKFQNIVRALAPHGPAKLPSPAGVSDEERSLFLERAKDIIRLIDVWTNHPRPQQLEDIVYGFYSLRRVNCQAVINGVPDDEMDKNAKNSLINMILKVARYAEAARFLFRTAKKFPIARRMQVVLVTLPESAFVRTPVDSEYKLILSSILSRIVEPRKANLSGQRCQTDTVCPLLCTNMNQADNDLTAQTRKTLTTGKIHAEVQLVFYCETLKKVEALKKGLLPPRIVCSSKKACFLCNMLVSMHGQMRTPWSHGKLYPGWRLPEYSGLDLQLRFNQLLEDRIMDSILLLFKRRGKTTYPGPSESTLITLPSLASELESALGALNDKQVSSDETQAEDADKDVETPNGVIGYNGGPLLSSHSLSISEVLQTTTGNLSSETNQPAQSNPDSQHSLSLFSSKAQSMATGGIQQTEPAVRGEASYEGTGEGVQPAQSTPPSEGHLDYIKQDSTVAESHHSPDNVEGHIKSLDIGVQSPQPPTHCQGNVDSARDDFHLQRGQKQSHAIQPNQKSPFYTTRSLEVQLEYSTGPRSHILSGTHAQQLLFSIERLGVEDISRLKDHGIVPIVDAEGMVGEIPLVMPNLGNIYIASDKEVFKITFRSGTESSIRYHQHLIAT